MIRGWIPGFARPKEETRYGDAQVITDGRYTLVIDGMCGDGSTKLIKWLKKNGYKKVWLIITHWHDDHFVGIEQILRDEYFEPQRLYCPNPAWLKPGIGGYHSKDVEECMADGERIVALARRKKVPITYPISGSSYKLGHIKFKLYKQQPKKVAADDTHAWGFINDGSISAWFPALGYWTSGDGCGVSDQKARIRHLGLTGRIKAFKQDHHGGYCSQSNAEFYKGQGAVVCWYNDLEPKGVGTTEFTQFGARRCKQAEIPVLESVGDINFIAKSGKCVWYKDFKSYVYKCSYKGKSTLKGPTRAVAQAVIAGKYGENNSRITNLLDAGYYPIAVQGLVNKILKGG
jgi:ribonuclease BN (tRNA processing enzyme)